jgi:hypothetical protein
MYGFIWRHLPGPILVRILLAVVLVLVVVAVLFVWVFPALAPIMPFNNGTVNQ